MSAGEDNYQPYVFGIRASGMGGAVSADAEGMDACYYNPAGLGDTHDASVSASASIYGWQHAKENDELYPGDDLKVNTLAAIPSGISAIYAIDDGLTCAFSVFVPMQAIAREIESLGSENKEHYYNFSNSLQVLLIGPSVGYKVNNKINLGVSAFCAYTSSSQFVNLYWKDYDYTCSNNYKYSVYSVLVEAGLQYRLTDSIKVGLVGSTPSMRVAGEGTWEESVKLGSLAPYSIYQDGLNADNGIPAKIKLGISWNKSKKYGLGLDATYHFAHGYDWLEKNGASFPPDSSSSITRKHKAVTDFQLGGEYYIKEKYPIRAGFFTSFSSAPDPSPGNPNELPQVDLYGICLGGGIETEHVITTVGVQYVFGSGESVGYSMDSAYILQPSVVGASIDSIYFSLNTAYKF
jgi:long-chain fatty acid transport protein